MRFKSWILMAGMLSFASMAFAVDPGPDRILDSELREFKAGPKDMRAYARLTQAFETAGILDERGTPEAFGRALQSAGIREEGCRPLGVALTERGHLRAAAYLARIHCSPEGQALLKFRKPMTRHAVREWPNIDG